MRGAITIKITMPIRMISVHILIFILLPIGRSFIRIGQPCIGDSGVIDLQKIPVGKKKTSPKPKAKKRESA
jgi:hypothetical protein